MRRGGLSREEGPARRRFRRSPCSGGVVPVADSGRADTPCSEASALWQVPARRIIDGLAASRSIAQNCKGLECRAQSFLKTAAHPMRIIAWNCNMALHKKYERLLSLRPDIAVIPECAHPDLISKRAAGFTPSW